MPNQELLDYIKKAREAGQTDEQVKSALITNGWQITDIEEAFKAINVPPKNYSDLLYNKPQSQKQIIEQPKKSSSMKKALSVILVVVAWGLSFWVLYVQIPEVRNSINNLFPEGISIQGGSQTAKENIPSAPDTKAVSLQQINNVGYSFYIGQIDYPNTPSISDDTKNTITQVIYKANFPKSLLKNVGIVIVNTLAVSSVQYVATPYGKVGIPNFSPDFMTGGGIYSQSSAQMSLIYINKTMFANINEILTHELGHHIGFQLTSAEWTKYYQLRKIPTNTPRQGTSWVSSPEEDFAEVYKNIFTGLGVRTYYGILMPSTYNFETMNACGKIYSQLEQNYIAKKYPNPGETLNLWMNGVDVNKEAETYITPNASLQNCRKDVLLHPEKYPNDWQYGTPYYSVIDQATKDFINQIISRLQ